MKNLFAVLIAAAAACAAISASAATPTLITTGDGTPSLPGNTIHPPVVIDYCIQDLGAMVNGLGDARRSAAVEAAIKRIKGREDA